jgi:hypothetical protein
VKRLRGDVSGSRGTAASGADRAGLVDLSGLQDELDDAIEPGYYVGYADEFGYAERIDKLLGQVEKLIAVLALS